MEGPFERKIVVPMRPPCVTANTGETVTIFVYKKGRSVKRKRGGDAPHCNIYLRVDALPWLFSYASDEFRFQNRPQDPELDETKTPNCSAVADLALEWDFDLKAWNAEFVAGEHKGVRKSVEANTITKFQWGKIDSSLTSSKNFDKASPLNLKLASKELLILWCSAVTRHEDDAFAKEFRVVNVETPEKKPRTDPDMQAAVADDNSDAPTDDEDDHDGHGM